MKIKEKSIMKENYLNIPMAKYVIDTTLLADNGLYYGGEVDSNGNVYREKDVLENDYSDPILVGGKYSVFVKRLTTDEGERYYNVSITSKDVDILLSESEFETAVREMNLYEQAEEVIAAMSDIDNLSDAVYRLLRKKYVFQDATDYILDNEYNGELPDDAAEIEKIGKLAEKMATTYVNWGKNDANLSYWDNIKRVYDDALASAS